jgi:AAHS family 4-hydroxybenzoate transporter-like MFS transporter
MKTVATLESLLDSRKITARQWLIALMIMLVLIVDGLDIQLLALVAPAVIEDWGSSRAAFGIAMSAAMIGMAIGSAVGGYLGDRFGKKTVLVLAMICFGVATAAASLTNTVTQMAIVRLLSGIGFGAAAPTGVALVSEWLPIRARAGVSALLSIGTPLGGILGASAVLALLPDIGWRGCFVVCGCLTLILAAAGLALVPSSPAQLLASGKRREAAELVRRIARVEHPDVGLASASPDHQGVISLRDGLFAKENTRLNVGSWLLFSSLTFTAYAFNGWGTVFLTLAGYTLDQAVSTTIAFNAFAVLGALTSVFLLGRIGSRVPVFVTALVAVASVLAMTGLLGSEAGARSHTDTLFAAVVSAFAGGATGGGIATVYGLLSFSYPSEYRSSGLGMGLMMGRIGSIIIALAGGALLAIDGPNTRPFFLVLSGMGLFGVFGALIINRHVPVSLAKATRGVAVRA